MIRTRFTEMFDLEYPIMSAPMAGASGGALATAVCATGSLGTFGAMNVAQGPDWVRRQVDEVRASTDRPFGVGFITHFIAAVPQFFDVALESRPPVIVLSFADPAPWIGRAKDAGAKVVCQVQTMHLAEQAAIAGADVLVAQGTEAGGHTGVMSGLPFLSRVIDTFPNVPVLAAGGIADGRTLAAVLAAGADGAVVGTALLASPESEVHDPYRQLIVDSDGADTIFTKTYDIVSGFPWPEPIGERVRANAFTARWHGREDELARRQKELAPAFFASEKSFDPDESAVLYGSAAGLVDAVRPAADVVRTIGDDAEALLIARCREIVR